MQNQDSSNISSALLIKNFSYLTFIQIFNYLIPFLAIPYIVRVIGIVNFGELSFLLAFTGLLNPLFDFGFNFTSAKDIALNIKKKQKLCEIFSIVFIIKTGILLIVLITVFIFLLFTQYLNNLNYLFFVLLLIFSAYLNNYWFFKGAENLKVHTFLTFLSKFIFIISVFLLVKEESDYYLLVYLYAFSFLLTGVINTSFVILKYKINIIIPSMILLRSSISDGFNVFISMMLGSFFTNANTLLLGLVYNMETVGYYAAAEKVIVNIKMLISNFFEGSYIQFVVGIRKNKIQTIKTLKKLLRTVFLISLSAGFLVYISSDQIIKLLYGDNFFQSVTILKILSVIIFLFSINSIFGNLTLLNIGLYKHHLFTMVSAFLFYSISIYFSIYYSAIGLSISLILTEAIVLACFWFIYKNKIIKNEL